MGIDPVRRVEPAVPAPKERPRDEEQRRPPRHEQPEPDVEQVDDDPSDGHIDVRV